MLGPPVALIAVVAVALAGRIGDRPPGAAGHPSASVEAALAVPRPSDVGQPRPPLATPTGIDSGPAISKPLPREEGTDGLMGRLPFGLPNDTPTLRIEPLNRFTIDDGVTAAGRFDTTPPWVRRLGGLANFRTDPYQR